MLRAVLPVILIALAGCVSGPQTIDVDGDPVILLAMINDMPDPVLLEIGLRQGEHVFPLTNASIDGQRSLTRVYQLVPADSEIAVAYLDGAAGPAARPMEAGPSANETGNGTARPVPGPTEGRIAMTGWPEVAARFDSSTCPTFDGMRVIVRISLIEGEPDLRIEPEPCIDLRA